MIYPSSLSVENRNKRVEQQLMDAIREFAMNYLATNEHQQQLYNDVCEFGNHFQGI